MEQNGRKYKRPMCGLAEAHTRRINFYCPGQTTSDVYEQEGKGEAAIVCLYYFIGNCNWYIIEKDSEEEQLQVFGIADLGYGPEYGYISIEELLENGVELDFHYEPRTVAEQLEKARVQ